MDNHTIMCPLLQKNIDEGSCFDIHMVISGEAPKDTAPEIANVEGYEDICNNCKNHRFD